MATKKITAKKSATATKTTKPRAKKTKMADTDAAEITQMHRDQDASDAAISEQDFVESVVKTKFPALQISDVAKHAGLVVKDGVANEQSFEEQVIRAADPDLTEDEIAFVAADQGVTLAQPTPTRLTGLTEEDALAEAKKLLGDGALVWKKEQEGKAPLYRVGHEQTTETRYVEDGKVIVGAGTSYRAALKQAEKSVGRQAQSA